MIGDPDVGAVERHPVRFVPDGDGGGDVTGGGVDLGDRVVVVVGGPDVGAVERDSFRAETDIDGALPIAPLQKRRSLTYRIDLVFRCLSCSLCRIRSALRGVGSRRRPIRGGLCRSRIRRCPIGGGLRTLRHNHPQDLHTAHHRTVSLAGQDRTSTTRTDRPLCLWRPSP